MSSSARGPAALTASESYGLTAEQLERFGPFLPPLVPNKSGLRDPQAALERLPLDVLPRSFFPKKKRTYRPPIFHLGYLVDDEWCIKLAKDNGFYEEMYVGEELTWDWISGYDNVIDFLVQKSGITSFRPKKLSVVLPPGVKDGWLMTISSTYFHHIPFGMPSEEDIDKLRVVLGRDERPKWWLSASEWYWAFRPYIYPM